MAEALGLSRPHPSRQQRRAQLALVVAAFFFGTTFVIVKHAVEDVTPTAYVTLRFAVGTFVMLPVAWFESKRTHVPKGMPSFVTLLRVGLLAGAVLGIGYILQTVGLQYTSTSNSAFITGLFVVFTPLLAIALRHRRLSVNTTLAVCVAVTGLFLLTGASFSLGKGDALTLACAFAYAVHIIVLSTMAARFRPLAFNAVQLAMLTILTAPLMIVTGIGHLTGRAVIAILFTGVVTSAFSFSLQVYGQRRLAPTRSALLLSTEPVFAGIIGYVTGERLGLLGIVGAALILGAIVIEIGIMPGLPPTLPTSPHVDPATATRGQ